MTECDFKLRHNTDYKVLTQMAHDIYTANEAKGFHDAVNKNGYPKEVDEAFRMQKISLIHSELSEAVEAIRKDEMDQHLPTLKGEEVEMADALIRILDYCGLYGINIGDIVQKKLAYNLSRPYRHGKSC